MDHLSDLSSEDGFLGRAAFVLAADLATGLDASPLALEAWCHLQRTHPQPRQSPVHQTLQPSCRKKM